MKVCLINSLADGLCKGETLIRSSGSFSVQLFITYIFRILVQTGLNKLFKLFGEIPRKLWGVVLGDQEENSHWMKVGVRWFSFSQLYCSDSQRPDIRLGVVGCK